MPLTATYARASRLFSPPCNRKPEFAHLRSHVKLQLGLGVENTNSSSTLLPRDKKVIAAIPIPGTFLAASEIRTSWGKSLICRLEPTRPRIFRSCQTVTVTLGMHLGIWYPSWILTPSPIIGILLQLWYQDYAHPWNSKEAPNPEHDDTRKLAPCHGPLSFWYVVGDNDFLVFGDSELDFWDAQSGEFHSFSACSTVRKSNLQERRKSATGLRKHSGIHIFSLWKWRVFDLYMEIVVSYW